MNNDFSVVFVTSWYPTIDDPTLGIFIRNHAKALSHYCNVIVIHVYSSDNIKEPILEHTSSDNLNEYTIAFPKSSIPIFKSIIHFFKYLYYYYKLSKLVKKHFNNIRFIQINVIYPVGLFFNVIKKILNIQQYAIFEQWSGYLNIDNQYTGVVKKWITRKIIKNARKIWCLCESQKEAMIEKGLIGNYDILGNTVNTRVFDVKRDTSIKNTIKKFIHVSSLSDKEKNISGILRVFRELEKEGYTFELVMIGGTEEYLTKAKQLAKSLQLSNVVFTGIVEQDDLFAYYQSADALVMFSNYETFCVVIYEALSCGTYVISTNVADLDKIISEDIGKIIPIKDEHALKTAIIDVLTDKVSCNSEKAHTIIESHFSEEVIGKKLYDYYYALHNSTL